MLCVGALKANIPGEDNPNCPAEPNMPWFLILGGVGITIILLIRIILAKFLAWIKNNQHCCYAAAGCLCEFSCSLLYDVLVMAFIVMWMITVSWWVFRHVLGPHNLYLALSKERLDAFRASLGDNDTIHMVGVVVFRPS